ncbi:class I SAM-dependent methyltransferase [Rhodococcus qingshengii]|uniref:class I SAM-dependent methyltransferase n=1 Tax=Rhodococcus qingshengii TaxID=334542 RepID=UPI0033D3A4C7
MDDHVRAERALSFGQIAEQYDRWRPGYPEQLYTDVLAAGTGNLILEAGAGTGRATLALAERGAIVTAIEPDLDMAEIARSRTSGNRVRVLNAAFKDTDPNLGQFDIVAAAQS